MSKQIQAYFQTEDQAEGAKTVLLTYKTEHLEVSKLVDPIGRKGNILLPLVTLNPVGNMSNLGAVGIMGAGGVAGINVVPTLEKNDINPDIAMDNVDITANQYKDLNYVLVAKVEADHYDEIVQKLREHHAILKRWIKLRDIKALSKM